MRSLRNLNFFWSCLEMSLKRRALNGIFWNLASALGKGGLNLIVTMVLSRFLPPADFALFALIVAVTAISEVFIDCGFGQAIIRTVNPRQNALSTLFFINIGVSAAIYVVLFALTPWFLEYFTFSGYIWQVRIAFLVLIFDSLAMVQSALFSKRMAFKPVTISLLTSSSAGAILAFFTLWANGGSWSLIVNLLVISVVRSGMMWGFSNWRPSFCFSLPEVRPYCVFGGFLLLTGVLDQLCTSLETFIIGKSYTKNNLAFVARARDLNGQINQQMLPIFMKVFYPALSLLQDDESRMKEAYRKAVCALIAFAVIPVFIMICCSESVIIALFGEPWAEAAVYLRIICLFSLLYPLQVLCSNIFLVKNRTDLYFFIGLGKQLVRIATFCTTCYFGIVVFVWGMSLVGVAGAIVLIFFSSRLLHYTLREIMEDIFPVFLIGLFCSALVWGTGTFLKGCNSWVQLSIEVTEFCAVYVFLCWLFRVPGFILIKNILMERVNITLRHKNG